MTRHFAPAVDARFRAAEKALRKSLSSHRLPHQSLPAVLTYPTKDFDNDFIRPDGGDWSEYHRDPVVSFDHFQPVGRGEVTMCKAVVGGKEWNLPVGVTTFFQSAKDLDGLSLNRYDGRGRLAGKWDANECLELAAQAERLVCGEVITGVSLELLPLQQIKNGYSLRKKRDSYDVHGWRGLGYAHTEQPVQPDAQLVVAEKSLRYAETHAGLHPLIRKSLGRLSAPLLNRSPVVRGVTLPETQDMARVNKAMDDYGAQQGTDAGGDTLTAAPEQGVAAAGGPPVTVAASMQLAQTLMDACDAADVAASASDNPAAKKKLAGFCDEVRKMSAKVQAFSDSLAAKLGSNDDSPIEADTDAAEPDTDDDGAVKNKSFPAHKARRLKLSDLVPVMSLRKSQPAAPAIPEGMAMVPIAELEETRRFLQRFRPQFRPQ